MTDVVVEWESFTVSGSQSGEIIGDIRHSPDNRTPDVCGMHTPTWSWLSLFPRWMMTTLGHLSVSQEWISLCEAVQTWHCLKSRNHNLSPTEPLTSLAVWRGLLSYMWPLVAGWNIWNVICLSTNGTKVKLNHTSECAVFPSWNRWKELRKVALGYNK